VLHLCQPPPEVPRADDEQTEEEERPTAMKWSVPAGRGGRRFVPDQGCGDRNSTSFFFQNSVLKTFLKR
jgi:hypothetical protein